jgi:hypothetical protein
MADGEWLPSPHSPWRGLLIRRIRCAVAAAELVAWLSAGAVRLSERDEIPVRRLGLTVMPALAGLLPGFAGALGRRPSC